MISICLSITKQLSYSRVSHSWIKFYTKMERDKAWRIWSVPTLQRLLPLHIICDHNVTQEKGISMFSWNTEFRSEGTLGDFQSQALLKAGLKRSPESDQVAQGIILSRLFFPGTISLDNVINCLTVLTVKKLFLLSSLNSCSFNVCPPSPVLQPYIPVRIFWEPPQRQWQAPMRPIQSLLFSRMNETRDIPPTTFLLLGKFSSPWASWGSLTLLRHLILTCPEKCS